MKNKLLLFFIFVLSVVFTLEGKELFHFNFKNCNGKTTLKSNDFTLISKEVSLLEQQSSLRLAPSAEIIINGPKVPLNKELTVSAWILNKRDIDLSPILSRGAWGDLQQFVFTAGPEFYTRVGKWNVTGIRNGNKLAISGTWKHITGVFNSGIWQVYVDGKLFFQKKTNLTSLPSQHTPFILGAQKDATRRMNYNNSDMLINDLHLFDHALTANDIKNLYNKERPSYPKGSLIPPGKTVRHALENCFHYAKDGYDPNFKKELAITKNWIPPQEPKIDFSKVVPSKSLGPAKLFINNTPMPTYMAFLSAFINHDRYELPQIPKAAKDFGAAGVKLVRISTQVWHPYMGTVWKGPGQYDFSIPENQIKAVLAGNPGAYVEFCISLNEAPPWFVKKYKSTELEQCLLPNGKKRLAMVGGELGSNIWKSLTEQYVYDFITHMEKSPYGNRIFGYNVCGGRSHEWYWPGTFTPGVPGYSIATAQTYNQYRKKKGLAPAAVPLPKERQFSETLLLRNPEKAADVLEFRRFLNDRTFECLRDLVLVAKKALKNKKIVGTYSGYSFNNDEKNHIGGLNIFSKVAQLPECDYVQLATVYGEQRMLGNAGLSVNPYNGSAMLNGKLFWYESDIRTALVPNLSEKERENRHDSLEDTAIAIKRNFAIALTRGSGLYEMTLNGIATFHNDILMNAVKENAKLGNSFLSTSRESVSQVAVFFDEKSALYHPWPNGKNKLFYDNLLKNFYYNHPKSGIPIDFYTSSDITNAKLKDYKLYIILNATAIDKNVAMAIRQKANLNNAVVLWCYAPGFVNNEKFDLKNMEKITGIPFEVSFKESKVSPKIVKKSLLFPKSFTIPQYYCQPVFTPIGKDIKIHATSNNKAIIAEKKVENHTAIYSLIPLDNNILRCLAKKANVHIYSNSSDVLVANKEHVFIHAATAGNKTIMLPNVSDVVSIDNKIVYKNVKSFTVKLKQYENRLYKLVKPNGK